MCIIYYYRKIKVKKVKTGIIWQFNVMCERPGCLRPALPRQIYLHTIDGNLYVLTISLRPTFTVRNIDRK